jgi:hypothetical protein
MHKEGNEVHIDDTEASGGSKEGVVRWVLIASTLLAILLMSAVWIIPALMEGPVEEEATLTGTIDQREDLDRDTDSILMETGEFEEQVDTDLDEDNPVEVIDNEVE